MKPLKRIYIEITNICNLSCAFCPPTCRSPKTMALEDFSHIIGKIQSYTDYVYLHVKGEPLLHPQLQEILAILSEHHLKAVITTNGTLLSKQSDILLHAPCLHQVNLSLHSFGANEGPLLFEDYLHACLTFAQQLALNTHANAALRLWNLDRAQMSENQRGRNDSTLSYIEEFFHLEEPLDHTLRNGRGVKLAQQLYLNYDYEFQWPSLHAPDYGSDGSCQGLRSQTAILVDGTVVPCCLDNNGIIALGNIYESSFAAILDAPRAQALITSFQNRRITEPLCRRCEYRTRF